MVGRCDPKPRLRVRLPSPSRLREGQHRFVTIHSTPRWEELCLTLLRQKLHQLLDINVHQVNRRDLAGMGSDPHDKILAYSIDDEEAVIVTADREPTWMA
jgi:hypothetical protein